MLRFTTRLEDEKAHRITSLAQEFNVHLSDVIRGLVILGLQKYDEEGEKYAQGKEDLIQRLEALRYDYIAIKALFLSHKDLSELNKVVLDLEAAKVREE